MVNNINIINNKQKQNKIRRNNNNINVKESKANKQN